MQEEGPGLHTLGSRIPGGFAFSKKYRLLNLGFDMVINVIMDCQQRCAGSGANINPGWSIP